MWIVAPLVGWIASALLPWVIAVIASITIFWTGFYRDILYFVAVEGFGFLSYMIEVQTQGGDGADGIQGQTLFEQYAGGLPEQAFQVVGYLRLAEALDLLLTALSIRWMRLLILKI